MSRTPCLLALILVAATTACPRAAMADVIDGNWCYRDGRHFSIRGPEIVTPAGKSTKGSWSRHSFSYQVPPAEPDGGQTIYMLLQDQNTVALAVGTQPMIANPAQVQIWHRCADQVSQRRRRATPHPG
jgi:hypothetical protein